MGNRNLKTRTAIGSAVDIDLYNKLKDYSSETKIPISRLLDMAIELLLKEKGVNWYSFFVYHLRSYTAS